MKKIKELLFKKKTTHKGKGILFRYSKYTVWTPMAGNMGSMSVFLAYLNFNHCVLSMTYVRETEVRSLNSVLSKFSYFSSSFL